MGLEPPYPVSQELGTDTYESRARCLTRLPRWGIPMQESNKLMDGLATGFGSTCSVVNAKHVDCYVSPRMRRYMSLSYLILQTYILHIF